MKKIACIAVMLIAFLPVIFGEIQYEEGIHFIRPVEGYIISDFTYPEYLSVEDVYVLSCTEGDYPISTSLLCLDNNRFVDLESYRWTDEQNCYISDYNLKNFECLNIVVQSEYLVGEENIRMSRDVRINKLTKVLDNLLANQYSDGGWMDSIRTAYGIWGLSFYSDIFQYEIEKGMHWLKMNRNDDEKCWPMAPCSMQQSANILALLTISNHTDYYRVLNDGQNLMKEMQLYYNQDDLWTVSISPLVPYTTLALVSYGRTILAENFSLVNSSWKDYPFRAATGTELMIISDENIKARIMDKGGKVIVNYQGDNLSYTTPGACWSGNRRGEPCDLRTTLWNTMLNLPEANRQEAKKYLEREIDNSSLVGSFLEDPMDPIDTSLFLYVMEDSHRSAGWMPNIVDWMTYNQNNEGSWGKGNVTDKALPTAYGALGLGRYGYNRSSEQIIDAERWASENEDLVGANDTINQAALFSILNRNARPLVTAQPRVIFIRDSVTSVDIFNPTTFDLTEVEYELSDNLADLISVEKKSEISSYSYRRIRLTKTGTQKSTVYGYLHVSNLGKEIGKIPIIMSDFPELNVTVSDSVSVFGTKADVSFSARRSAHEFICDVSWESSELTTPGSFKISSESGSFPVSFRSAITKQDVYQGTMTCKQGGKVFTFRIAPFFTRYSSEPLDVTVKESVINSTQDNIHAVIRNNLDTEISVVISLGGIAEHFQVERSITLSPNEEREIVILNRIALGENVTGQLVITFESLGRKKTESVFIDVEDIPKDPMNLIVLLLVLSFIAVLIGGLAYFGWKKKEEIIALLNKLNVVNMKKQIAEEKNELSEIKSEERDLIITNLFKIMRFQNKDDKEIKEALLKNFSREQIRNALELSGNSLSGIEEEEPEKE